MYVSKENKVVELLIYLQNFEMKFRSTLLISPLAHIQLHHHIIAGEVQEF